MLVRSMKQARLWMLAAILAICDASVFAACTNDDAPLMLPMLDVGGDLYDFSRQGDLLWFLVGDVSGKGVPAALFMSATVNLFRSALNHQHSPKAIMEEISAVLSDNNPSLTFVTAFIGCLHIPS